MEPKPPGWSSQYAAVFAEHDVVAAYHLRPPYPQELIDVLARLAAGGAVLDAGCGTGEVARRIASSASHVDAVDVSDAMIAAARTQAGGGGVRWIAGAIEGAELEPPYALVTTGDSIHWFDWSVALPRFAELLAPGAPLAIMQRNWLTEELSALFAPLYRRHSWNRHFERRDPAAELERRGLFTRDGEHAAGPEPWRPTLDELVGVHFSTSGLAWARLDDPEAFAADVRAAVVGTLDAGDDGRYDLSVTGRVVWGRPAQ